MLAVASNDAELDDEMTEVVDPEAADFLMIPASGLVDTAFSAYLMVFLVSFSSSKLALIIAALSRFVMSGP
jgi:hypothetical protein